MFMPGNSVVADADTEETEKEATTGESLNKSVVRHLAESELSGYTIYDVLLPLPGYSVTLPDNEVSR